MWSKSKYLGGGWLTNDVLVWEIKLPASQEMKELSTWVHSTHRSKQEGSPLLFIGFIHSLSYFPTILDHGFPNGLFSKWTRCHQRELHPRGMTQSKLQHIHQMLHYPLFVYLEARWPLFSKENRWYDVFSNQKTKDMTVFQVCLV